MGLDGSQYASSGGEETAPPNGVPSQLAELIQQRLRHHDLGHTAIRGQVGDAVENGEILADVVLQHGSVVGIVVGIVREKQQSEGSNIIGPQESEGSKTEAHKESKAATWSAAPVPSWGAKVRLSNASSFPSCGSWRPMNPTRHGDDGDPTGTALRSGHRRTEATDPSRGVRLRAPGRLLR